MPFEIDLGIPERDAAAGWNVGAVGKRDGIMNGVLDALPPDATQAQIDAGVVAAILGDLYGPATLSTVRSHLLRLWPLIADLADREPAQFDSILIEYAELTTVLQEQEDIAEIAAILPYIRIPRLLSTARGHLVALLPRINDLATREPERIDALLREYAGLTVTLPADRSEANARRKAAKEFSTS